MTFIDKSPFIDKPLLLSLEKVLDYGDTFNIPQADERNRIVERKEVPLFHAEAYREAVINAFVHNLWIDGNAPMFTGFRDRIEILSRGHLPPKQTVEGFLPGNQFRSTRNCRIFFFSFI